MKKAFAMRNVAILAAVAVVVYLLVNNTKMTVLRSVITPPSRLPPRSSR